MALGTIAQLELLDDVIPEAAAAEIGPADTPVSYTHLDVYKRQGHGCGQRMCSLPMYW